MKHIILILTSICLLAGCKSKGFLKQRYTHFSHSTNEIKEVVIKQRNHETYVAKPKSEIVLVRDTASVSKLKVAENAITETFERKTSFRKKRQVTFTEPACNSLQVNEGEVSLYSSDPVGIGGISNAAFNFFYFLSDIYTIVVVLILLVLYMSLILIGPYLFKN